jgi:hypothetical protein
MSSIPLPTDPNKLTQSLKEHDTRTFIVSSEQTAVNSPSSLRAAPTLSANQFLTENDHEDNLMDQMDELIRHFLRRPNRRSPYCSLFRWTFDDTDESKLSYSVVVKIEEPSRLIKKD